MLWLAEFDASIPMGAAEVSVTGANLGEVQPGTGIRVAVEVMESSDAAAASKATVTVEGVFRSAGVDDALEWPEDGSDAVWDDSGEFPPQHELVVGA